MDPMEKSARKRAWRSQQRAEARAKFPLPQQTLKALFDWLDLELGRRQCDHSLRLVREWAATKEVDLDPLTRWLRDNGGYCDCEALSNAEQAFEEACKE